MSFWELEPWIEHATTAIIKHPHENWHMQQAANVRQQKSVIPTVEAPQKYFPAIIYSQGQDV